MQEVVRWRDELVVIVNEVELPLCKRAALAKEPGAAFAAAIGFARASTMRKNVYASGGNSTTIAWQLQVCCGLVMSVWSLTICRSGT